MQLNDVQAIVLRKMLLGILRACEARGLGCGALFLRIAELKALGIEFDITPAHPSTVMGISNRKVLNYQVAENSRQLARELLEEFYAEKEKENEKHFPPPRRLAGDDMDETSQPLEKKTADGMLFPI